MLTNAVALHVPRRIGLVAVATRHIKVAVAANLDVLRPTLERAVS